MTANVGGIDRVLRIWGWIGVVPLLTGLLGWCPPYALLGLSTCKK